MKQITHCSDFQIRSLGVVEEDVYDIEVEDAHNFFANDILVHNSCYLTVNKIVKKLPEGLSKERILNFVDKFCNEKLQPTIEASLKANADYQNAFQFKMGMKREAIASSAIWRKKKNYAILVDDEEGERYHPPKLKIAGIETQKTSSPLLARLALKDLIYILLTGTEEQLQEYYKEFYLRFTKASVEEISFPRKVQGIQKYKDESKIYKDGTQAHIKGSILYNHFIDHFGLQKDFTKITDGSMIKFCYLKANPLNIDVIAFNDKLPEAFKLHSYVDYNTQFDKAFGSPAKSLYSLLGWSDEPRYELF